MQINKIDSYNTNFKSLKIDFHAPLHELTTKQLHNLEKAGDYLSKTEYVDLEVLKDLTLRIRKKGDYYSGIIGKIIVKKPEGNENVLNFSAIYDGLDTKTHKRGKRYDYSINLISYEKTECCKNLRNMESISEMALLTKLIDKSLGRDINYQKKARMQKRKALIENLENMYGDFIH